jgi:hypothetical protein
MKLAAGLFDRLGLRRNGQPRGAAGRLVQAWLGKLRRLGLIGSSTRFVLSVGDEGATLVQFRGREAVDALFIGPETEDGPATLRSYVEADPNAEVLVAADVLEQMYREEQLPRVGRFDRHTIVKRRLDITFPHDRLKAAVQLDSGKTGSSYLFTALPETPVVERWIEFLEGLRNPVIGFCLLPLESALLAQRLAPSAEGEPRRVWHALVTQQATSGFRQIFASQGDLVVTRLTQRPPGELTADAVAMLVERELRSSISYIKRLGYSELDRLDLVVLATPEVCAAVEKRDLPVHSVTALPPHQASQRLGFGAVGPQDSPYADILHAQCLAAKRHPRTTLSTPKLRIRLKANLAFKAGAVAAAILSLVTLLYVGTTLLDAYDSATSTQVLQEMIRTERQALETAQRHLRSYPIPVEDLTLVDQAEAAMEKDQVNPASLFHSLAGALDPSVRVAKIAFLSPPNQGPATTGPAAAATKMDAAAYEIRLTVRFSGDAASQADLALKRTKELRDRLSQAFPGHDVSISQMPLNQIRNGVFEGSASAASARPLTGPASAEFTIRKRA